MVKRCAIVVNSEVTRPNSTNTVNYTRGPCPWVTVGLAERGEVEIIVAVEWIE